ncbi:hypothetical protein C8Q76DRAFT_143792 [Earliella scabrosa]|nr:hypothetical protein C8Q76DRAFT_143792 [Earliella scabrosa]
MACATDTDITFLFNQGMSLPDDLMLALERLAPKILIDEYGVGTFGAVYSAPRETAVAPFLKGTQAEVTNIIESTRVGQISFCEQCGASRSLSSANVSRRMSTFSGSSWTGRCARRTRRSETS